MCHHPPLEVRVVRVSLVEVSPVEEDCVGVGRAEGRDSGHQAGNAAVAVVGGWKRLCVCEYSTVTNEWPRAMPFFSLRFAIHW